MNLPTGTGDDLLRLAAVQMNSRDDKAVNIQTALELIDRAAGTGARLVALPEVWTYLGPQEGNRDNAEPIPSRSNPAPAVVPPPGCRWHLHKGLVPVYFCREER